MPSWPGEYRYDPVTAVAVPPASNSSRWSVPAQPQTAALTRSSMSVAITSANAAAAIHGCLGRIGTGCGNTLKRSRQSRSTRTPRCRSLADRPCGSLISMRQGVRADDPRGAGGNDR